MFCHQGKGQQCEFTSRREVNEIKSACKGALKEHLEGRLQILNNFRNDGDIISIKKEVQTGDLNRKQHAVMVLLLN